MHHINQTQFCKGKVDIFIQPLLKQSLWALIWDTEICKLIYRPQHPGISYSGLSMALQHSWAPVDNLSWNIGYQIPLQTFHYCKTISTTVYAHTQPPTTDSMSILSFSFAGIDTRVAWYISMATLSQYLLTPSSLSFTSPSPGWQRCFYPTWCVVYTVFPNNCYLIALEWVC